MKRTRNPVTILMSQILVLLILEAQLKGEDQEVRVSQLRITRGL